MIKKLRSIVVRGLIIFMGSTLRLSDYNLAKLNSNYFNGIVYVQDIGCNGQLPVLDGRWE